MNIGISCMTIFRIKSDQKNRIIQVYFIEPGRRIKLISVVVFIKIGFAKKVLYKCNQGMKIFYIYRLFYFNRRYITRCFLRKNILMGFFAVILFAFFLIDFKGSRNITAKQHKKENIFEKAFHL